MEKFRRYRRAQPLIIYMLYVFANFRSCFIKLYKDRLYLQSIDNSLISRSISFSDCQEIVFVDRAYYGSRIHLSKFDKSSPGCHQHYALFKLTTESSNSSITPVLSFGDESYLKFYRYRDFDQPYVLLSPTFLHLIDSNNLTERNENARRLRDVYGQFYWLATHLNDVFYCPSYTSWSFDAFFELKPNINTSYIKSWSFPRRDIRALSSIPRNTIEIQSYTKERYPNSRYYCEVSGIDSFIMALLFSSRIDLLIHVLKLKHVIGALQVSQVETFWEDNLRDKVPLKILRRAFSDKERLRLKTDYQSILKSLSYSSANDHLATLNRYTIDLRCLEYIRYFHDQSSSESSLISITKSENSPATLSNYSKLILRGVGTHHYQCFSGSLQRDKPFIFGHLRGSLRRLAYSSISLSIVYVLSLFRSLFDLRRTLIRVSLVFTLNVKHKESRYESKFPSFQYIILPNPDKSQDIAFNLFCKELEIIIFQYLELLSTQSFWNKFSMFCWAPQNILTIYKHLGFIQRQFSFSSDFLLPDERITDATYNANFGSLWNIRFISLKDVLTPKPYLYRLYAVLAIEPFNVLFRKSYISLVPGAKKLLAQSRYYDLLYQFWSQFKSVLKK